jgi:outer membrane protein assembly factor BamB
VRHAAIIFTRGGPKLRFPITVRKISGTTTLYGGNGAGTTPVPGGLVILDQAVGTGTLLGDPVTPGWLTGIAFTSTGVLYGTTNEGGPSSLVRIDPDTGGLVTTTPIIDALVFGGPVSIADLAVQPGTDVLFGIRWNGDGAGLGGYLYRIHPPTGLATLVGDTRTCTEGGLAFGPDGTLYFAGFSDCSFNGKALHVLNPATGAILSSIPLNFFYESLAARPSDGALFASSGSGSLYEIDPATGVEVFWGETGTGELSDLAFR